MQQGRKLDLITVDKVEKPVKSDIKSDVKSVIHVVVILVRAHPGESPASFVCQGILPYRISNIYKQIQYSIGFLEFLLSNHPISSILRENFIFKIIPMLNPDGVFLGNNRCNLVGQDLNRTWNVATEYSSPTLVAAKNMLKEIDNSEVNLIKFKLFIFIKQFFFLLICYSAIK